MDNLQLKIDAASNIPVFHFIGHCKVEGIADLGKWVGEMARKGQCRFVFDFSTCKLINSPAMGELLDAILLIDRDFEGHIVVCGLDSLKETLFTISGIIPIAQEAANVPEAIKLLVDLKD